jgi:putative hydrolase of the HAD superfamily
MIALIGFDADDTLWQNEYLYTLAKDKLVRLLKEGYGISGVEEALEAAEMRNLHYFGYGIKSFTLSMLETAARLVGGSLISSDIQQIIDYARDMLQHEVRWVPGAREALARLSASYRLILITKGDLFEQAGKIQRSGAAPYFQAVEIVTDKTLESYQEILARHQVDPQNFLMVGNSMRSDITPVIALGSKAVYIPDPDTWEHENQVTLPESSAGFYELENITALPALVASLSA